MVTTIVTTIIISLLLYLYVIYHVIHCISNTRGHLNVALVLSFFLLFAFTFMAVKPSSGLLKLEEQLKCSVCLDLYTNPKTLPCLHSFCQECLEGLPQEREARGDTYYLSCPTCRQRTEVPREGVGAFPVAFTLNNLKEIAQGLKNKVSDPQQVTCNDHGKPLEVFCETCKTVICLHCVVRTHKDHKYDLISDCYPKHYQMLQDSLKPVKGKKQALKKVLSKIAEREGQIKKRGEGILEEIHQMVEEMVEEMVNVLRRSERKLTEQVKRVTDAKLQVLSGQTKSVQTSLSLLEDVEDYVEQSLKTGYRQQVLSSKKQMMEHMSEVTTQINEEELRPIEKNDLRLIKDRAKTLKSLHHIGTVSYTALQECRVKIVKILKEKRFSFSLSMEAQDSSLVSVPVSSFRCSLVPVGKGDQPIHTTVTTTSTPGVYRIRCNPSTSGTHTVKVQVYDVQLEDTSLVIPFKPCLDNITPVRTITKLNGPWGVAVSDDGRVIVTENSGHRVKILDNEGKKVKSLRAKSRSGDVEFSSPRGVAITPDNFILVSDSDNHRIQKISMDGYCVASVDKCWGYSQKFSTPDGIAISPITGQVFIADWDNHCIQILNPGLTFSRSFGSKGSASGRFHYPHGIAIDSQGLVYVADTNNHRIQKFTPDGKFVAQLGSYGSGAGQLQYPYGITIDTAGTGLVYVSEDGNHRVSVFTSDGVFVSSFGREGSNINRFNRPRGLTFDKEGFLYVCDSENNRLVIYGVSFCEK